MTWPICHRWAGWIRTRRESVVLFRCSCFGSGTDGNVVAFPGGYDKWKKLAIYLGSGSGFLIWQFGLWRWEPSLRRGTGIRLGVLCFGAFRGRTTGELHLRHVPAYEMLCSAGGLHFLRCRVGMDVADHGRSRVHVGGEFLRGGNDPADQSGIWNEFQGQQFGVSILESSGVFREDSTGRDNSHHT